jgi:hypothetical protein
MTYRPRQLCPRNSLLCSLLGNLSDPAVNFDRILTDLGAILKDSGHYRRGGVSKARESSIAVACLSKNTKKDGQTK